MIDREWITEIKVERRNCGRARALMFYVEPPEKIVKVPRYENMVDTAEALYRGAMGDDGRVLRDVDVMAWSDSKMRILIPHMYRVTANFVLKEDMEDEEVDSEE